MENFNVEEDNIQVPTCFKNPENPKSIDLMLTTQSQQLSKLMCT